jgi:hypothetical protein
MGNPSDTQSVARWWHKSTKYVWYTASLQLGASPCSNLFRSQGVSQYSKACTQKFVLKLCTQKCVLKSVYSKVRARKFVLKRSYSTVCIRKFVHRSLNSKVCTHKFVLTRLHSQVCTQQFVLNSLHSKVRTQKFGLVGQLVGLLVHARSSRAACAHMHIL